MHLLNILVNLINRIIKNSDYKTGLIEWWNQTIVGLQKGAITEVPVNTKFGYHVIMLNDVRNSEPKALNVMTKQILERIRKLSLSNLEKEIRKNQNITIVDFESVAKKVNK